MIAPRLPRPVLFGAAYYTEYQPVERTRIDLDLMADAGFTVIRVGESVWSTWEPREGEFDLDWLQPVLDGAHERGISVVMGTPTYAVPPWMHERYPETAAQPTTGRPLPYGGRQDADFTNPTFRFFAERVIRRIAERYRDHPAVIGWQLDNEPGAELLHNPGVFARFKQELREQYGDAEALNRAWGLTYWSHRVSHIDELWPPDGNTTPAYDLAWRRFQASLTQELVEWQAELVRSLVPASQFVTTCLALGRPALDVTRIGDGLDIVATNVYYATQDGLRRDADTGTDALPVVDGFPSGTGTDALFLQADVSRGCKQGSFLVTETGAGSIGGPADVRPAYPGQWRQVVWALVARGARMVEYWHWHTLHHGAETYWGGVLPHSLQPGRCYKELAAVGAELGRVGEDLRDLAPVSDVGVLVSSDSRWALSYMSPLPGGAARSNWPQGWFGDTTSYDRVLRSFYRGLFDVGLMSDVVAPHQLPEDAVRAVELWPVLVAPAAYVLTDDEIDRLLAYAHAGGHLVLTPRTAYADGSAAARHEVMPGRLREAAGASYEESTSLARPVPVHANAPDGPSGHALGWADMLRPEGAEVLSGYDDPFLEGSAAVTTARHGSGRVTTVGAFPDRGLARSLAGWVARTSLPEDLWRDLASGPVTAAAARTPDGSTLRFLHNWSWDPVQRRIPTAVHDLLADVDMDAGSALELGPWQVRVLRQHNPSARAAGPDERS
jgi:beta-galactosidase